MSLDFDGPLDHLVTVTRTALDDANGSDVTFTVLEKCRKTAVVWAWTAVDIAPENYGTTVARWLVTYSGLTYVRDLGSPTAIFDEATASVKKIAQAITADMSLGSTVELVIGMHAERNPLEARLAGGFTWYPYNFKVTTLQWDDNDA